MKYITAVFALTSFLWIGQVRGEEPKSESKSEAKSEPKLNVETALTGLTNPCGVAIQPVTGAVFISDTGAGQIVKLSTESNDKSTPVVTDYPQEINGKETSYGVGPLGIVFYNQNTLVSGEGALKRGDEVVRVFDLPADGKPLAASDAKHKIAIASNPDSKVKNAGNFFDLLLTSSALWVTAHGANDQAFVLRADLKGNTSFDNLKQFIQAKAETKVDALIGITTSKQGFLVLSPRSDTDKPKQSLLAFYSPKSGNLLMQLPTSLHDVTGLAYSPKSGRLYAVDFAWDDPSQGGLYRLDAATVDGRAGVKAVKITALDKPSALVFAPDNTLYVAVFGSIPVEPKTNKPAKPGKLLKITGDL